MNNLACALTGVKGEQVALTDVSVSAVLHDLLSEVTVSQVYRNDEKVNIEAVYTFPLPLDAVLLELQVEIGGRVLKGVVVEKKAAEEKYEDAVAAGDAAVMLEMIEPGLYTMNVGNLLPQEKATITFSYAILYRWAGDRLRLFLPTTVAPRFGDSPHAPHQAPEFSLTVENQFSLNVEISGSLRDAQFVCPSHQVALTKLADKVVISLQQAKAVMDRDFILNVKAPQATRSFALCGSDGDGLATVASFQPFFPGLQQPRPLNLAIVIDCSGSMQGDSMEQAKQALEGILDALQAHDQVTLIAFGNATNALSDRLLPCNKTNLVKAKHFAKKLDANMGGTEIGGALQVAYKAVGASESADIFLVTDGEVSSWEAVVQEARGSGHRIFTVGVGSAVSEAFVRGLAAGTGGECELVSPQEGMADRVIRHFERMRAPRAKRVEVHWPEGAHGVTPSKLGAVFEGDTVIACARFDHPSISGNAVLEIETEKGEVTRQELPISIAPSSGTADPLSTVARLAAATRLRELDDGAGLETALRYRLVSPWTNWLVLAARPEDEKAQDLPELRKVPQTLAAGWGGVGQVLACSVADMSVDHMELDAMPAVIRKRRASTIEALQQNGVDKYDIPAFLRKQADSEPLHPLLALIEDEPSRLDPRRALDLLKEAGLASEFHELFQHAIDLELNVDVIAAIVLAGLLRGPLGEFLSPGTQGAIASLQDYAKQATEALREMGRHGIALAKATRGDLAREILRSGQAQAVEETLERLARFRDLLEHLYESVRKLSERLEDFRAARARRESGIIA
jgi:Ca-activated chloride channel family protein